MGLLIMTTLVLLFGGSMSKLAKKRFYVNDHRELFEMGHVTDLPGIVVAQMLYLPDGFALRLLGMAFLGFVVATAGGTTSQVALALGVLSYLASAAFQYRYNAASSQVKGAAFRQVMKTHDSRVAERFRNSLPSQRLASTAEFLGGVGIVTCSGLAILFAARGWPE